MFCLVFGSSSLGSKGSEPGGSAIVEFDGRGVEDVVLAGMIELKIAVPNDGVGKMSEVVDMLSWKLKELNATESTLNVALEAKKEAGMINVICWLQ